MSDLDKTAAHLFSEETIDEVEGVDAEAAEQEQREESAREDYCASARRVEREEFMQEFRRNLSGRVAGLLESMQTADPLVIGEMKALQRILQWLDAEFAQARSTADGQ